MREYENTKEIKRARTHTPTHYRGIKSKAIWPIKRMNFLPRSVFSSFLFFAVVPAAAVAGAAALLSTMKVTI